jgi:hypothetical protein
MSALMSAALGAPPDEASPGSRAAPVGSPWVRSRWEAVDAWTLLQQSSSSALLSTGEQGWTSAPIDAGLGAVTSADRPNDALPIWQVRRLEQVAQFQLAQLT